jgi:serine protease
MTGTSMAAPHVSGVAALMWSQNPKVAYNNAKIREVLRNTAVDLGSSGKDKYFGYGKVNAYAAATSGVVLTGESGSFTYNHEDYTFSVSVPAPSAVNVVMAGNENADFDLYAKWGSPPTTSNYDARGYSVTSLEYFTVEGSGTLYIMVRSWWGTGNWKCWVLSGDPSANSGRKRGTLSETGDTATYSLSDTGIGYAFNSGPDGSNFDLYTKWNSPPTTTSYDARGYTSWAQEIAGPTTNSGTLHFMVRSRSGSGEYATVGEIF